VIEPKFLLDSNICIYLLEGLAPAARRRIEGCRPGEVVTSAIAFAEVMRGVPDDGKALSKANALFEIVRVLAFDDAAARACRRIPFRRGTFDRLIAAHALSLGLIFVTNDEHDYDMIEGLAVENWTRP
jgi:tRNA(fMet)-specific endonuclease VapC